MKPLKTLADHWDENARSGDTFHAKTDASLRAQLMRFEDFLTIHKKDLKGRSVLDVGCGTGGFYERLKKKRISCDYLGVDISPEMIRICRDRFPAGKFELTDILKWKSEPKFDYSTAFAINTVVIPGGWDLFKSITQKQFELCRVATHFTCLTDRYPKGFASHIQPWPAERVLEMALKITPFVTLQHHYLPNDFSVTLYRDLLIDRCPQLVKP
ncbi:class I SAM-dependent methyltransferase [soil metagenome]